MSVTPREPVDLRLWRERQKSGLSLPWDDFGIRLLAAGVAPRILDDSRSVDPDLSHPDLSNPDLSNPDVRAALQAAAETNERIVWVAEAEGEHAFGYWSGAGGTEPGSEPRAEQPPAQEAEQTTERVIVALDTEGQYTVLPGRDLTEALSAHAAEYNDDAFVELLARARDLAGPSDPELASTWGSIESLAALPHTVIDGPGKFRESRYTALRQTEPAQNAEEQAEEQAEDREQVAQPVRAHVPPGDLPQDLLRWQERAAAGEGAPWDRFGVRFLAAGEFPGAAMAPEPGGVPAGPETEATWLTARLAAWAVEYGEGRGIGYWRGPDGTLLADADLIAVEPGNAFDRVAGSTITEALCAEFGDYNDERVRQLVHECRALGFDVESDDVDDFAYGLGAPWRRYRDEQLKELQARARQEALAQRESVPQTAAVVTGEVLTVIAAIGHGFDTPESQRALALFGPPFTRSHFGVDAATRVYYVGERDHADVLFEDGIFTSASIQISSGGTRGSYARPGAVIDGVDPDTTRDQILERFGEPEYSIENADRFWLTTGALGKVFLRFQYLGGRVEKISVTT